ncbi:YciI family protein [Micromonospora sp. LOL_024]|uniref:YciI family protein n=1 Tax=Micromonospora sp. LOL_024 TaxID=3345412 RepID=UPI003A85B0EB
MLMHKLDENRPELWNPSPEFIAGMGAFMEEATQAGVLLAGEGLRPSSVDAGRITVTGGRSTVTDGPFTETKELIAGFALIQVRDKAEAMEWGRRFAGLFAGAGADMEVDVRRVTEWEDLRSQP